MEALSTGGNVSSVLADVRAVAAELVRRATDPDEVRRTAERLRKREYRRGWLQLRADVFERDHYVCVYCLAMLDAATARVDHVVPRSRGGSDDLDNLATACPGCNSAKGDRTPLEWSDAGGNVGRPGLCEIAEAAAGEVA